MVHYRITLLPLVEEIWAADPGLLSPFYVDNAAFDGIEIKSAQLLKLILDRGSNQGYFPEPAKSLFIAIFSEKGEAAKIYFWWKD